MKKGIFVMDRGSHELIYGAAIQSDIMERVEVIGPCISAGELRDDLSVLKHIDLLFTGWGAPVLDEDLMAAAPQLAAVFHGAGGISHVVTPAFWRRGIPITSAKSMNAIPVAEFTLAQIVLCLRRAWFYAMEIKRRCEYVRRGPIPGTYESTVGVISLGQIGQRVCKLLKMLDVNILAVDPFCDPSVARELRVELCELDELFCRCDVISLHAPWLKTTEGMIVGRHFAAMKQNAAFINTARGAIVKEDEMWEAARHRPDLQFVLDVVYPEPPAPDSPVFELPNVILTPHISGSLGHECRRMGRFIVEELDRFLSEEELLGGVDRDRIEMLA